MAPGKKNGRHHGRDEATKRLVLAIGSAESSDHEAKKGLMGTKQTHVDRERERERECRFSAKYLVHGVVHGKNCLLPAS
jgi:hypothetical protein